MIIQEDHIEKAIAYYDTQGSGYEEDVKSYLVEFPLLSQYVFSDNFAPLNEQEKYYFESLVWIIVKTTILAKGNIVDPLPKDMVAFEEKHWEIIQSKNVKDFRDLLTPFFDLYDEEEALAFVEDSLCDDDELTMPREIKELIFIGLTTVLFSIL